MKKIQHGVGGNPHYCNCSVTIIYDDIGEMYDMEINHCKYHQAAPDLLEALKGIFEAYESLSNLKDVTKIDEEMMKLTLAIIKGRQAIDKAEGKSDND